MSIRPVLELSLHAIRRQFGLPERPGSDSAWSSLGEPSFVACAVDVFAAPLLHWYFSQIAGDALTSRASPPGPLSIKSGWRGGASTRDRPLSPPLHPLLMERGPGGEAAAALHRLYYANAARKAALLALLEQLAAVLDERGIPFLLLKGAALEAALDLPPALRVMADLDLLVPPQALPAAEQALAASGLTVTRDAANAALLRRRGYHLAPYVAADGSAVELHREPLPRTAPFRLRAAELSKDSLVVSWRGWQVRVPSPEHLFLHTCIHYGYWHTEGVGLRRVWDLALIATRLKPDAAHLAREAARCGATRLVASARRDLDALLSGEPGALAALCDRLFHEDDLWSERGARGRLRARARQLDRLPQRWALLRHTILPAWEETANATGCPSPAHHLCHFLHPRRLWRGVR